MHSDLKIICITPVKNESWILDSFLKCTSLWADQIIIADQNSTDTSRSIALKYPKVKLIENNSTSFNESGRQQLLIDAARSIPCTKRIIIALDADEILAGDIHEIRSTHVASLAKGTVLRFRWLNCTNQGLSYWDSNTLGAFGYIDDGAIHIGAQIHSHRIPYHESKNQYVIDQCPILHLQYLDWKRMKSKHRWYQCYEMLNLPNKSVVDLYRTYHYMDHTISSSIKKLDASLIAQYTNHGINPFDFTHESNYWWDYEVISHLKHYGVGKFKFLDVWEIDKALIKNNIGNSFYVFFKRGVFSYIVLFYLRISQANYAHPFIQYLDRKLKSLFYYTQLSAKQS